MKVPFSDMPYAGTEEKASVIAPHTFNCEEIVRAVSMLSRPLLMILEKYGESAKYTIKNIIDRSITTSRRQLHRG